MEAIYFSLSAVEAKFKASVGFDFLAPIKDLEFGPFKI